MEIGFCIVHSSHILSAWGVWFTFVYRKHEHLAVGSSDRGLTRSRGHPSSGCLALPVLRGKCRHIRPWAPPVLCSPQHQYNTTLYTICQHFFEKIFTDLLHGSVCIIRARATPVRTYVRLCKGRGRFRALKVLLQHPTHDCT